MDGGGAAAGGAGSGAGESRWSGADDVLLKDSLQQGGDFDRIARNVRFSVRANGRELEQRWQQLLFDEAAAAQAASSMAAAGAPKRILWTEAEEEALLREASSPDFKGFLALLESAALRPIFHCSRTAKSLEAHYYRMKSRAKSAAAAAAAAASASAAGEGDGDEDGSAQADEPNFSDAEEQVGDELAQHPAPLLDKAATRAYKKEVQKVERTAQRHVLQQEKDVEREKERDRDSRTLALLRGRRLRHAMRSKELVIGRAAGGARGADSGVDVDLWEEGDASRVSRQQAVLKLKKDCEFYIRNVSATRPLLVNGQAVAPGKRRRVPDGALIECGRIELLFEANKPLLGRIKRQLPA